MLTTRMEALVCGREEIIRDVVPIDGRTPPPPPPPPSQIPALVGFALDLYRRWISARRRGRHDVRVVGPTRGGTNQHGRLLRADANFFEFFSRFPRPPYPTCRADERCPNTLVPIFFVVHDLSAPKEGKMKGSSSRMNNSLSINMMTDDTSFTYFVPGIISIGSDRYFS